MPVDATVHTGPEPGWLGTMVAMHGRYYAEHWRFPPSFEARVAAEAAAFLLRHQAGRDLVLTAHTPDRAFAATVTLDVSDPAHDPRTGHLRWFIVDSGLAGRGLGRRLIEGALDHARAIGLRLVYLTTFKELTAAGRLYAGAGFRVVQEMDGATWGRVVREQRLELSL